jgi:hypothetical protein
MIASMTINENSDIAQRTSRDYDYKVFIALVEINLTGNNYAPLRSLAPQFCDVSGFKSVTVDILFVT